MQQESLAGAGAGAAVADLRGDLRSTGRRPRCLRAFELSPSAFGDIFVGGQWGGRDRAYHLACACGHDRFHVFGPAQQSGDRPRAFAGRLSVACAACQRVEGLFNPAVHGHDAELGHLEAAIDRGGRSGAFVCGGCGVRPMTVDVGLEYAGDPREDSSFGFAGNEHNVFTRFTVVGRCDGCSRLLRVADIDCA